MEFDFARVDFFRVSLIVLMGLIDGDITLFNGFEILSMIAMFLIPC